MHCRRTTCARLQVFAEQVVNFIGTDEISPPLEFASFTFTSWAEVSKVCGDSRVWGGMHFAVSLRNVFAEVGGKQEDVILSKWSFSSISGFLTD